MPKRLPRARTLKGDPKLVYYDAGTTVGSEPAIVLSHSSLARSEDWENIFPRLATRYRVVAYDARGHGKSARASDYTLRSFADDALRVLREVVKAPAVLIGHSLGALSALVSAAEAPELVRGAVLEDPALGYARAWDPSRYGTLREAVASADPVTIDARVSGDDPTAAIIADAIARVRAPVLVLAGEPRLGGALDDASEWRLKKLADVTIKRFPGSGHLIHGFRPEQFIENLEPFLRKIREGEAAPA